MMDGFYIVWSPTGSRPPSARHETYTDAKREAERLARFVPDAEFFVMAAVSRSQKISVLTEMIREPSDEMPF